MGELTFELKPVVENHKRTYINRRKHGLIIDEFLSGDYDLVRVDAENKEANYLRGPLVKIIKSRGLEGLARVSVVSGELYLERTQ